jgi:16S rRNA (guanine527-N7)-methyltransferase
MGYWRHLSVAMRMPSDFADNPDSLRPTLIASLRELGVVPDSTRELLADRLLEYLALLQRWNATYNLTAIRDPAEMVSKHLLDSLAVAPFVEGALADLGSGAGLPGIPLALARPELQVTLVESNGKKARFLREASRVLRLDNARIAEVRAERLREPTQYDCVISRAFSSLGEFVRLGAHLLKPGGRMLAMKGLLPTDEIAALPKGWRLIATHPLRVPGLDAQRHLLELVRDAD